MSELLDGWVGIACMSVVVAVVVWLGAKFDAWIGGKERPRPRPDFPSTSGSARAADARSRDGSDAPIVARESR